jgi:hypothetical protein
MKNTHTFALLATLAFAACEGDFRTDPTRPRPSRALGPAYEHNSALGEMQSGTAVGTPILTVELPNTKEEQPRVRTIADPTDERPATRPPRAPIQPAPTIILQPGENATTAPAR